MIDMKNVMRYEHSRTKGWWVRLRLKNGETVKKLFSDGKYDGKRGSLKAALAYRDSYLPFVKPAERALPRKKYKRNKSGVIGVAPIMSGDQCVGWKAYVNDPPGVQKVTLFKYKTYGMLAKKMAVEYRKNEVNRIKSERQEG